MRGRHILLVCAAGFAVLFGALFAAQTRWDAAGAWSRFEALEASGYDRRAVGHGERSLDLYRTSSGDEVHIELALRVADAQYRSGLAEKAAAGYTEALTSDAGARLPEKERVELRRRIAELELGRGRASRPAIIAAGFLEAAGDAVAHHGGHDDQPSDVEGHGFLQLVDAMRPGFTDALPADGRGRKLGAAGTGALRLAEAMTEVGGYYALAADGAYAAAGLLSAAYQIRLAELGQDAPDTVQTALLLAPIYERIDRLSDAEALYAQAFQAQERAKGPNNPELSLYIRLLADIYEKQGRLTEAEALNRHMHGIFADAYGSRRYQANRSRDRLFDVDRPVSPNFPLEAGYVPPDLVRAAAYGIPLSKPRHYEEMQLRLARTEEGTMPENLAELIGACSTTQERLTLRSAYRSHRTQRTLHRINAGKGTVADPGTSEHQLGLAADIDVNRRFMRATDKAYACFEKKAWKYGFILSFPPGNSYLPAGADSFEPWHWRYVGRRTALLYREIGPWGQPQEFLAALPCYEEQAVSGLFVDRERGDVCAATLAEAPGDGEGAESG